jgi:hypothetical protein
MTVLQHSVSERMARVPHRTKLSREPEGKPTGTDERWCGQEHARDCGTEVGREGAASPQVWPVRSRGILVEHAWLFSFNLKESDALTTRASSSTRKSWTV